MNLLLMIWRIVRGVFGTESNIKSNHRGLGSKYVSYFKFKNPASIILWSFSSYRIKINATDPKN